MAAKTKPKSALSPFDGREVLRAEVAIRNAGDGLSDPLSINPEEFHHGQIVDVVLRCVVDDVQFPPVKGTDALRRKHIFRAQEATIVDSDLVEGHLAQQRERIEADRVRREEEEGIHRLPFDNTADPEADPLHVFDGEEDLGPMPEPTPIKPARKRAPRKAAPK